MANDSLNPYAAPGAPAEFGPVYYAGKLSADDLRMALLDAPPKVGWRRLETPMVVVFAAIMFWVLGLEFQSTGTPLNDIHWLGIAFVISMTWFLNLRFLTPGYRKRVRRVRNMAANNLPSGGWITDEHVFYYDGRFASKLRWEYFGRCLVFHNHLMLCVGIDQSRRVVIPWHHFEDFAGARQVQNFATQRLPNAMPKPPSDKDLARLLGDKQEKPKVSQFSYEKAVSLDGRNWPYDDSSPEGQQDFQVDLAGGRGDLQQWLWPALLSIPFVIWFSLPLWVVSFFWGYSNYHFYGDLGFIAEKPISSFVVVLVLGALTLFMLANVVDVVKRMRSLTRVPATIGIRERGIHLCTEQSETWIHVDAISQVDIKQNAGGWRILETGDDLAFGVKCFESVTDFNRFCDALNGLKLQMA